jgi:hypothetical protein
MIPKSTPDQILPGLSDRSVTLHTPEWCWGDNSSAPGLKFLCQLAAACDGPIVEIGTFRGRTTYNLAMNTKHRVYTIDIGTPPPGEARANKESRNYPAYQPGEVFLAPTADPSVRDRIELIIGDSSTLDLTRYYGRAAMVLVDAGHTFEGCTRDSETAFKLVRPGGFVLWDDYGGDYWPGVKQALHQLAATKPLAYLPRENFVVHRAAA